MSAAQTPPLPAAPGSADRSALLLLDRDPLVVLLARAAQGDKSAQQAFGAARAFRIRMGERLTEHSRQAARRLLDPRYDV